MTRGKITASAAALALLFGSSAALAQVAAPLGTTGGVSGATGPVNSGVMTSGAMRTAPATGTGATTTPPGAPVNPPAEGSTSTSLDAGLQAQPASDSATSSAGATVSPDAAGVDAKAASKMTMKPGDKKTHEEKSAQ